MADHSAEHRVRVSGPRGASPATARGGRVHSAGRAGRVRGCVPASALRRDGPAGGAGPRAGQSPQGAAARRAARGTRPVHADADAGRNPTRVGVPRDDDASGHPRHRRSAVPERPDRDHVPATGSDRPRVGCGTSTPALPQRPPVHRVPRPAPRIAPTHWRSRDVFTSRKRKRRMAFVRRSRFRLVRPFPTLAHPRPPPPAPAWPVGHARGRNKSRPDWPLARRRTARGRGNARP